MVTDGVAAAEGLTLRIDSQDGISGLKPQGRIRSKAARPPAARCNYFVTQSRKWAARGTIILRTKAEGTRLRSRENELAGGESGWNWGFRQSCKVH